MTAAPPARGDGALPLAGAEATTRPRQTPFRFTSHGQPDGHTRPTFTVQSPLQLPCTLTSQSPPLLQEDCTFTVHDALPVHEPTALTAHVPPVEQPEFTFTAQKLPEPHEEKYAFTAHVPAQVVLCAFARQFPVEEHVAPTFARQSPLHKPFTFTSQPPPRLQADCTFTVQPAPVAQKERTFTVQFPV